MKLKRIAYFLAVALLLSLLAAAGTHAVRMEVPLTHVVDAMADADGTFWLIDDNRTMLTVWHVTREGRAIAQVAVRKTEDGVLRRLDSLCRDTAGAGAGDGSIYVYVRETGVEDWSNVSETIRRVNVADKTLETVWNLPMPAASGQNNLSARVLNGKAYYVQMRFDPENIAAQVCLFEQPAGGEPTMLQTIDYLPEAGFSDACMTSSKTLVASTPDGAVYSAAPDGTISQLNGESGETLSRQASVLANFTCDGESNVFWLDVKADAIVRTDTTTGERTVVGAAENYEAAEIGLQYDSLRMIRFSPDMTMIAAAELDDGTKGLFVCEPASWTFLSQLRRPTEELVRMDLLAAAAVFGGIVFVRLLALLVWFLLGGRTPILVKQLVVLMPVMTAALIGLYFASRSLMVEEMVRNQFRELFAISQQKRVAMPAEKILEIDLDAPYDNVYFSEIQKSISPSLYEELSEMYASAWGEDGTVPLGSAEETATATPAGSGAGASNWAMNEPENMDETSYCWLFRVQDDRLVALMCDQNGIGTPIEYLYDAGTTAQYYRSVAEKASIEGSMTDVTGDWAVAVSPILDGDGKVVAVLETGVSKTMLQSKVEKQVRAIGQYLIATLVLLLAVVALMLSISLASLRRLEKGVLAIIDGQLGVQVRVRGRDEIARISEVFNRMSEHISRQIGELTSLNEGYYKFVPNKMFEMLRKSSVTDVHLGDQMKAEISILTVNAVGFGDLVSTMNADRMFRFINGILSSSVPVVTANGGVVDRFFDAGFVAFFTEGSAQAMNAAVSLCQQFAQMHDADGPHPEMSMAVSHGPVMIGIVGHERRLSATTISEHANLTGFLRQAAPKYAARILTTGAAIDRIPDFREKYGARMIGFLQIRGEDAVEKLYDVYDGDDDDMRRMKRQTCALFEKGVSLYCTADYREARLCFIEVLKQFRGDRAASLYVYRCDRVLRDGPEEGEMFVERF